jgi:hypothetical protein
MKFAIPRTTGFWTSYLWAYWEVLRVASLLPWGLSTGLHLNNSFIYFRLENTCHLVKPRSHLSTKKINDLTTSISSSSSDALMSPMILSCLFFLALPSYLTPIPQLLWFMSRMIHGPDQLPVHGQFEGLRIRFSMRKYTSQIITILDNKHQFNNRLIKLY